MDEQAQRRQKALRKWCEKQSQPVRALILQMAQLQIIDPPGIPHDVLNLLDPEGIISPAMLEPTDSLLARKLTSYLGLSPTLLDRKLAALQLMEDIYYEEMPPEVRTRAGEKRLFECMEYFRLKLATGGYG